MHGFVTEAEGATPSPTVTKPMYDKDRERIEELLSHGMPQTCIIEGHLMYGTTKSLSYYIRTRGLRKQTESSKP